MNSYCSMANTYQGWFSDCIYCPIAYWHFSNSVFFLSIFVVQIQDHDPKKSETSTVSPKRCFVTPQLHLPPKLFQKRFMIWMVITCSKRNPSVLLEVPSSCLDSQPSFVHLSYYYWEHQLPLPCLPLKMNSLIIYIYPLGKKYM